MTAHRTYRTSDIAGNTSLGLVLLLFALPIFAQTPTFVYVSTNPNALGPSGSISGFFLDVPNKTLIPLTTSPFTTASYFDGGLAADPMGRFVLVPAGTWGGEPRLRGLLDKSHYRCLK